jgi:hypothetical protein
VRFAGDDSTDDAFCLTCDGRGGRRGTGRNCTDCRGAGTFPTRSGSRLTKCKSCNGSGLIFAHRDRCRACNGINPAGLGEPSIDRESMILDDPPPPYSSMASVPYNPATYNPAPYNPATYKPATYKPATYNPATYNPATTRRRQSDYH